MHVCVLISDCVLRQPPSLITGVCLSLSVSVWWLLNDSQLFQCILPFWVSSDGAFWALTHCHTVLVSSTGKAESVADFH